MNETVGLGRIAGVRVGVNWSVAVVFGLIAWGLAAGRWPFEFPGHHAAAYWAAGVAAATGFLACLLAHEMAHALAARRDGVEVEGITLWLLGGIARLRGDSLGPSSELRIAAAGPAASIALAGGLAAAAAALDGAGAPLLAGGTVRWLGSINALLAGFNLVPAFPLDGGRIMRALLWRRLPRRRATALAAWAGRAFAIALIAAGAAVAVRSGALEAAWLVFLGWFLFSAARLEQRHVELREDLARVRVGDVMSGPPVVADGRDSIGSLLDEVAAATGFSAYPVRGSGGAVVGIVRVDRARRIPPSERASTTVAAVADPIAEVSVAAPEETIADVIDRLPGRFGGRALVFADGELVGIVSPSDLAAVTETGRRARGAVRGLPGRRRRR